MFFSTAQASSQPQVVGLGILVRRRSREGIGTGWAALCLDTQYFEVRIVACLGAAAFAIRGLQVYKD